MSLFRLSYRFTTSLLALFAFCGVITGPIAAADKPNVIVFLSDDQGWGDLSLNGNTNLETPRIDSLAQDGARFDRFYVCPVCSPTRAEFLTGRYHPRSGVYSTSAGGERLDLDEMTIAETFKAAGYKTAAFGKWHNGMQYPYHPNARGFDHYYGFCSGHWGNYFSPPLELNGKLVRGKGFIIDDLTNHALKFIEQHKDDPFFIYLPYNTPHSPMQVPDSYWDRFRDKKLKMHNRDPQRENIGHIRCALAMCENIDWNVGRVLDRLEELKLADNTIVAYFCDNGPNGTRWNGDMKGRKGSTDEGGVRSPLLVRWPNGIKSGTFVKHIAGAIDLLPTLADLAGIKVVSKKPLDGVSLKPLLTDSAATWPARTIFSFWKGKLSARTDEFRLDNQGRLFDLDEDPGQRSDISKQHPDETARLQAAVKRFRSTVAAELGRDERPFVVGHPDATYTQIPARDANVTGGIKRSNRFPNCSYFTNWTKADEQISWDVSVPADGMFEVEVYYACPAENVGSTIRLSFNDSSISGKVAKANDPPVLGAEHDRVQRMESYVRDFKPLKLGTLALKKGSGKLVLEATEIPGQQVMDFRLIMLKRLP